MVTHVFNLVAALWAGAFLPSHQGLPMGTQDSTAVATAVERYHKALALGDTSGAMRLLANDAVILESGDVETREEYRAHHLGADIEFARVVPSRGGAVSVVLQGDVAWAVSTSKTQGTFRGRPINSQGAELMVLSRDAGIWRIRAIHWSSHPVIRSQ